MIIDTTQTKMEKRINRLALAQTLVEPIRRELERAGIYRRLLLAPYKRYLAQQLSNEQKEAIIAQALQTDEGRIQLAAAMVEPKRCGGLEYD